MGEPGFDLSQLDTYMQKANMQVSGVKLWFVEGTKVLEFILYLETVKKEWSIHCFPLNGNHKIIFFCCV